MEKTINERFILSAFGDEIHESLKVQMDVLERNDIHYIEMRGISGKNVSHLTAAEAREIKKQLDDRGFGVSALGSPIGKIGITEDFQPHLDLFRRVLELAAILDTRYIRMFSFYIPEGKDPAGFRSEVMERWAAFLTAAEGTGITLLHENEKDIYGDTALRCLDLLETMNSCQMKLTFDPANFIQCGEETWPGAYGLLRKHIGYMHIKDAMVSDGSVTPAGYGDGRFEEILKGLYVSGYSGFLSIEPHLASFAGLAALERVPALKESRERPEDLFRIAVGALRDILNRLDGPIRDLPL